LNIATTCTDPNGGTACNAHNADSDTCIAQNDADDTTCIFGTKNIRGVAVSPDGNNVYAVAEKSIVHWDRDSDTGALSNQVNLILDVNLDDAQGVTVSPDGNYVYATAEGPNSGTHVNTDRIVWWNRDSSTGALSNQAELIDYSKFNTIKNLVISHDGNNAYTVALNLKATVYMDRNSATGVLSNPVKRGGNINLQFGLQIVVISPDDKHVYVVARHNHQIVTYIRDSSTGSLKIGSGATVREIKARQFTRFSWDVSD